MMKITVILFISLILIVSGPISAEKSPSRGLEQEKKELIKDLREMKATPGEIKSVTGNIDVINKLFCTDRDLPPDDLQRSLYVCQWSIYETEYDEECEQEFFKNKPQEEKRKFICTSTKKEHDNLEDAVEKCAKQRKAKGSPPNTQGRVIADLDKMKPIKGRRVLVKFIDDLRKCVEKALKKKA